MVFDVLFFVFFREEAEAFAGAFRAIYILLIENIAKFLTAKTIDTYLFMPDPAAVVNSKDPPPFTTGVPRHPAFLSDATNSMRGATVTPFSTG